MSHIEYRDSILDEEPELCPDSAIVRYYDDEHDYIEVTATSRGIEVRATGLGSNNVLVSPQASNVVEIFVRERT